MRQCAGAQVRKYYGGVVLRCACMAKPSISMPDVMLEEVDRRVGLDRSGYVRSAIDKQIYIEDAASGHEELPDDWWQDALDDYLERFENSAESIEVK